ELVQNVAVFILNPVDVERRDVFSFVGESSKSPYHFHDGDITGAQPDGRYLVQIARDTDSAGGFGHHIRTKFFHHVGRNGVDGSRHGLPDCHPLIGEFPIRILRTVGGLTWDCYFYRLINDGIARAIAVLDGSCIHKGFEGGTRLPIALLDVIVLYMHMNDDSEPSYNMDG